MTIKTNYLRAFVKIFLKVFIAVAILSGVFTYFHGKKVQIDEIFSQAALGGTLLGIFSSIAFTPRKITWDEETFTIKTLFSGTRDFEWNCLEAWSPNGRGVFLIKFEDDQAYQIAPDGFRSKEWKPFAAMLQQRFPDKKTLLWFGVRPIRFRKQNDD